MPEITLGRYWNPGDDHFAPGDVIEVDEAVAEWLARTGAVATPEVVDPIEVVDEQPEETGHVAEAPAGAAVATDRPARTASIETWRDYAEAQGIATKGLSKQELIAATR